MKKTHLPPLQTATSLPWWWTSIGCHPGSVPVKRHRERHRAKAPETVVWCTTTSICGGALPQFGRLKGEVAPDQTDAASDDCGLF